MMKNTRKLSDTFLDSRHTVHFSADGGNAWSAQQLDENPAVQDFHLQQLLGILRRRLRFILTVATIGAILAGIAGLLIAPKYTARAQVVVETQSTNINGPPTSANTSDDWIVDNHVTMLTARAYLQRVIDSLLKQSGAASQGGNLNSVPHTSGGSPPRPATMDQLLEFSSSPLSLYELGHRLSVWIRALSQKSSSALNLDEVEQNLKVLQERRSHVITVSFTAKNPITAAAVANRIVQLYIENQGEQRQATANDELTRIDSRLANLKSKIDQARLAVQKAIQLQTGLGGTMRDSDVNLRELERDAASNGQLYDSLLRRQKEIRDQQALTGSDVHILAFASPPNRPSSTNPILFMIPALVMFAIGASFIALIKERLDRGVRSERDIGDTLGIPCIGLVPQLPLIAETRPHQHLMMEPFAAYAEAIRSAVTALQLAVPNRPPKTILVSSSVPQEGKTTLAVSLAVYTALLGRRVLLIDLDFRNPSISRELNSDPERGILDLLIQGRPSTDVIQHIPNLGLDYLAMPRNGVDPIQLFSGKRMPNLLRQLGDNYDCVIIDGPPLLGITESRLLASMVDKVLFVVKWGSTRRDIAQNALNLLRSKTHPGKDFNGNPSALVTQVDLKQHALYRYGDSGESLATYSKYYSGSSSRTSAVIQASKIEQVKGSANGHEGALTLLKPHIDVTATLHTPNAGSSTIILPLIKRYRCAVSAIQKSGIRRTKFLKFKVPGK